MDQNFWSRGSASHGASAQRQTEGEEAGGESKHEELESAICALLEVAESCSLACCLQIFIMSMHGYLCHFCSHSIGLRQVWSMYVRKQGDQFTVHNVQSLGIC